VIASSTYQILIISFLCLGHGRLPQRRDFRNYSIHLSDIELSLTIWFFLKNVFQDTILFLEQCSSGKTLYQTEFSQLTHFFKAVGHYLTNCLPTTLTLELSAISRYNAFHNFLNDPHGFNLRSIWHKLSVKKIFSNISCSLEF